MESSPSVDPKLYSSDYYSDRCGGIEFFKQFGYRVLKPTMQMAVLAADLKAHHKILDLGCGRGELVAHLHEKGFDIIGVDYAEDAIQFARTMYPAGTFVVGNANRVDFEDGRFDRIFLLGTIEHLYEEEIKNALTLCCRLLKPQGKLLINTCTNRLYHKTMSYRWRKALIHFLNQLGLKLKSPSPPRSDEDEKMHINEKHYFSLKKSLQGFPWKVEIRPKPNSKLLREELYGPNPPAGLPLKNSSKMKKWLSRITNSLFPFNLLFTRTYLVIVTKK